MKKNSIADYLAFTIFRVLGPLIRVLPVGWALFLGRLIGGVVYCFDFKHRALVYANIKRAIGEKNSCRKIAKLTRKFYSNYGQNLIDIFLLPKTNPQFISKYITIQGKENIAKAFNKGKGVIFLAVHAGSWELSNCICSSLGFSFSLLIRDQKFPRLNVLLNSYRRQKGFKIIEKENQTRRLIEALKNNEAIGMTLDQGGKTGVIVDFFGHQASMASGAVRLALKYGSVILPSFYTRLNGPYQKLIIGEPIEVKDFKDAQKNIHDNIQELVKIFQGYLWQYPAEYLWSYKIWKYGRKKNILLLSDGKVGHLRQSQAAAKMISEYLKGKEIDSEIRAVEVKFKNNFSRIILELCGLFSGKYSCQGCNWCLNAFIVKIDEFLEGFSPDIIVSCGSSLAQVNYVLAREALAKSVCIMRPSLVRVSKFDLVVMPRHDNPPKNKDICVTEGALNLIDQNYLKIQSQALLEQVPLIADDTEFNLGFLLGGDAKDFHLQSSQVKEVISQLKLAAEKFNAGILSTTSRRTSKDIESLLKNEFKNYPRSKLLVIANERNLSSAVGGILCLSRIVVVSAESISMISEAVSSGRYVIVFDAQVGPRHREFLNNLSENRYIYLSRPCDIYSVIEKIIQTKPEINILEDGKKLKKALNKII